VNKDDIWNIPYIREIFPEDSDDDLGYNLAEITSDESDVEPEELSGIRKDLEKITKHGFEYLIKKEKKNRRAVNKSKGYKRAWVHEHELIWKEYLGEYGTNTKKPFEWF
jgi:hypothetical protein